MQYKWYVLWCITGLMIASLGVFAAQPWSIGAVFDYVWGAWFLRWDEILDDTVDSSEIEDNSITESDLSFMSWWSTASILENNLRVDWTTVIDGGLRVEGITQFGWNTYGITPTSASQIATKEYVDNSAWFWWVTCQTTWWVNGWDEWAGINCWAWYLAGMRSWHVNWAEDRRFQYKCCYPEWVPTDMYICKWWQQSGCMPTWWSTLSY